MKKSWLTGIGLGAACAVCCAPLLTPILAGAGLAGIGAAGAGFSLFKLGLSDVGCVFLMVSGIAAFCVLVVAHRRAKRRTVAACACEATRWGSHCDTGGGCEQIPRTIVT
jgi:hypothetical protein